jgi:hypothetical protein
MSTIFWSIIPFVLITLATLSVIRPKSQILAMIQYPGQAHNHFRWQ